MSHDFYKQIWARVNIEMEMIGEYDGFTLKPGPGLDIFCPHCGIQLLEVTVYNTIDPDAHGHAMPCGCRMVPMDLANLLKASR